MTILVAETEDRPHRARLGGWMPDGYKHALLNFLCLPSPPAAAREGKSLGKKTAVGSYQAFDHRGKLGGEMSQVVAVP